MIIILTLLISIQPLAQDTTEAVVDEIRSPQYVAVLVEDVARSVGWYGRVFGLHEVGGSQAEDGSWQIANLRNDDLFVEIIRDDRAEAVERSRGFFKVGFGVPNIEAVADRIAGATGERPRVLDFEKFGIRIIQIRDPDGNIVQLSSPLARVSTDGASSSDLEAIMAQSRRLSDAYVRGDIETLVSIYTSDGVAAPAGRDFIRGRQSLLSLWSLPEGRTVLRHKSTPVEIEVDGDRAFDWGYYEGQAAQDGEPLAPFRGTYVIGWRRGTDGVWRIAVDMWSSLRDPPSN